MKYFILLILFVLSICYAGYYLYMFDKKNVAVKSENGVDFLKSNNSKKELINNKQLSEHFTERFWKNATPEQLKEKLENIKNVNWTEREDHRTMLHLSALYGKYPELIGILVSAGADLHIKDRRLLRKSFYSRVKPLYYALTRPQQALEFTREFLKYDKDLNEVGFVGKGIIVTPLTFVAFNRIPIEIVELLLERGADPNFKGATSTPLIEASRPNKRKNIFSIDPEVIQLLLDYKADITRKEIRWNSNKTAYDYMKENPKFVRTELFKQLSKRFFME